MVRAGSVRRESDSSLFSRGRLDTLSPQKRSELMARIRTKDTEPELRLRRWLHAQGLRYRLHDTALPGRPDIVFPSRKKVVFVHGCFWHRHDNCGLATHPKTRAEFWRAKFASNVARDRAKEAALLAAGWGVLIVWQCELDDLKRIGRRVLRFLDRGRTSTGGL
ncbi:MAG TPA: very short patch repair endonuclease [Ramlibacter sp.]|uniref:very short patch repair endonuclease n=1 Tax=Ramlibacter sp. TaxID=1917967 RepID=UPI002C884536|nr:very short patch repair endonuclease [Ramlibacter sp.]HVZ43858.1 very short patch repair endonuclease [Ramlibacter sp.]